MNVQQPRTTTTTTKIAEYWEMSASKRKKTEENVTAKLLKEANSQVSAKIIQNNKH